MKPRWRWAAYGAALVALWPAMRWGAPARDAPAVVGAVAREPAAAGPSSHVPRAPALERLQARGESSAQGDPFAALRAPQPQVVVTPSAAPAHPEPPPLPYAYVGRFIQDGRSVVFLQRDGGIVVVRGPGALDAEYLVTAVDERHLSLKYLPLGIITRMRFDASPAAEPTPVAAAPAADEIEIGN